jgi:flagellar biogenesis protein FliO
MKPVHLTLYAIPLTFALATQLSGQENSSQILARGQATTLPAVPTRVDSPASFPSLSPTSNRTDVDSGREDEKNELAGPAITVTSSLVVVLGLFAGLVWATRKFGSRGTSQGALPKEVLQSLGSAPIDARTRITMVRCGHRILVMAQTATGIHPLSEITDADEVRQLTAACLGDSKRAFASALQSIEKEKSEAGYVGTPGDSSTPRDRGRLFASA